VRRRRTKFTWFPVIGGDTSGTEGELDLSTSTRSIAVQGDRNSAVDIFPIIPDEPKEVAGLGDSLVDFVGTSWLIARLVGKLHISYSQVQGAGIQPNAALVTAGFFVARADASATSVPIGDDVDLPQDYGPLSLATQREPWMWRRSWILGNNAASPSGGGAFARGQFFPATNSARSVADGPHIDCKVKRRSSNDERLFFALQTCSYPPGDDSLSTSGDGELLYTLDLRVLGTIRKQKNRSAF